MDTHAPKFKVRLGLFIAGGLALFVIAIFLIGKQKNLFDPVFKLTTTFYNVGGLQVGSNIRFSGINVGTVDNIKIINDTTVQVDMLIKKSVRQFIKADCEAGIGSSGIIGDRILIITQGSSDAPLPKDGQHIASKEPVETDAIMASVKVTADNAAIISNQLAEIMSNLNHGNGTLARLIQDSTMGENINQTIVSLKKSSKGLDENMNAAKDNFLLKGYFDKEKKAAKKVKDVAIEKKVEEQKVIQKEEKKEEKAVQKEKDVVEKQKVDEQKVIQKEEKAAQKVKDVAEKKNVEEQKVIQKEEKKEEKAAQKVNPGVLRNESRYILTGGTMKKTAIVALISAFLVTGCAVGFMGGHHGRSMVIVPALPEIVELDADQYYSQSGYYYRYQGNVWVYSESREGPWSQLPRDRYPKQVRYKGHDEHDQGNRDQDNRGQDNRGQDNRGHDNRGHDNQH